MLKLITVFSRRADLTHEEFLEYWGHDHATLVAKHADTLRIRRYVQNARIDSDVGAEAKQAGGWSADAVSEVWWDSEGDLMAALATPAGRAASAALVEDEVRFCDRASVVALFAEEHTVIDAALTESP